LHIVPRGELAERKGIHKIKGITHDFPHVPRISLVIHGGVIVAGDIQRVEFFKALVHGGYIRILNGANERNGRIAELKFGFGLGTGNDTGHHGQGRIKFQCFFQIDLIRKDGRAEQG